MAGLGRPKQLLGGRRGRRRGGRGPEQQVEARATGLLKALRTPQERLKGHAGFVGLLTLSVDAVDRWSELRRRQQIILSLVHFGLLQNGEVRKTAIAWALRRSLDELRSVMELMRVGAPRALAMTWLRRPPQDRSPFLTARVRSLQKHDRLPLGLLIRCPPKPVRVKLGRQRLLIQPGAIRARGKPKVDFPLDWGKQPALWIATERSRAVDVRLLTAIDAGTRLFLDDALEAEDRVKVNARAGVSLEVLVVPPVGPPLSANPGLRDFGLPGWRRR
jgi:hypothetical protein